MIILLNYKKGNAKLKEGLEDTGNIVLENIWDVKEVLDRNVDSVLFEFKRIFKEKVKFFTFAARLKKADIPIITWNLDSPWNMGIRRWKVNLLLNLGVIDIYATHSLQGTARIKNAVVLYLPNAVLSSRYSLMGKTLEDLRKHEEYKWDVSFLGNLDFINYPEHRRRVAFLKELEKLLSKEGIHYLFLDSKNLSIKEQVEIIQKSKINLNCLSAADSQAAKSWGLPERCYGIPACGGFLLMDDRVHVNDDFSVGEDAVTYQGVRDCMEKIVYYLDNHEERRRIAEKAYARVMRNHTYQERAITLVRAINSLKGQDSQ